jgi:uncharacterized membrane protein
MTPNNLAGLVVLLGLSLLVLLAIWGLLSKSLKGLLNQVLKLADGTTFYLRSFFLCLLLAALAGSLGTTFDVKPGAPLMEYVWKVAGGLHDVCGYIFAFLLGYLALVTVLVTVLRARHEQ